MSRIKHFLPDFGVYMTDCKEINGGVKTTRKAQDCPNVKGHFHQANFLSEKIWASFDSKEISLDNNDRLIVEKDYKLNL